MSKNEPEKLEEKIVQGRMHIPAGQAPDLPKIVLNEDTTENLIKPGTIVRVAE
jgi:hypothetical protein